MSGPASGPGPRYAGRVAVVTGAAAGIGAATARRLADEGAAVVIADIAERGKEISDLIVSAGGRAAFVRADVAGEEDWAEIVGAAHTFGPVDLLVSNAYTLELVPLHETSRASWDRQLAVNLTAAALGFQALLPDLRAQRGSAVFVSSVHARFGLPNHAAYAAAKGGLVSLAGQLAVEYGPEVRVNTVLPGPILTAVWDGISEADRETSARATAAGRLGAPEEVAAVIAFLGSADASYVTGASLLVDGGWSVAKDSA